MKLRQSLPDSVAVVLPVVTDSLTEGQLLTGEPHQLTSSQGNLATSGWWRKQVAQVGTDQGLEVADGAPRANCSTSHS